VAAVVAAAAVVVAAVVAAAVEGKQWRQAAVQVVTLVVGDVGNSAEATNNPQQQILKDKLFDLWLAWDF